MIKYDTVNRRISQIILQKDHLRLKSSPCLEFLFLLKPSGVRFRYFFRISATFLNSFYPSSLLSINKWGGIFPVRIKYSLFFEIKFNKWNIVMFVV